MKRTVDRMSFNPDLELPFQLRQVDFEVAMQDVYDFFGDVNELLIARGLKRFEEMLRPAAMSGIISDMLTASMANHARSLVENQFHNGHPDLIVDGEYPDNSVGSGEKGIEIKTTRKKGGSVDMHGARPQWLCVFEYRCPDEPGVPARERSPMEFMAVYLVNVTLLDFRKNPRGELGTRTASLNRQGLEKMRKNWVYKISQPHN